MHCRCKFLGALVGIGILVRRNQADSSRVAHKTILTLVTRLAGSLPFTSKTERTSAFKDSGRSENATCSQPIYEDQVSKVLTLRAILKGGWLYCETD